MNVIIITGASSGIGEEFAYQLDEYFTNIDEFWLIARNREKLNIVADRLQHKTRILSMDITKDAQLERLEDTLQENKAVVRMLINCAGYGLMGAFQNQDREGMLGMVHLNCEALTNITHRLIPYMRRGSRIIQMASSAAFLPQTDFAVYAATKSYVLSFSRALGEELREHGIYVTSVCPGPVDTPFFDIAEKNGTTLVVKKYTMVKADRVVAKALRDSYHKRTMSVCSLPMQLFEVSTKILPHDMFLQMMTFLKKREKI
ncbi:MAG: SDR family NAD(P)-dependent oxidoreductase [Lachnospiraceae bacterium]|nr:SDR family NAD(P)-dependent oxidoreductase [Lachnospiraceae bacterium]